MKICTRCITPETAATIEFDKDGVCNVCRQAEIKHGSIDWDARRRALDAIADKYRNKTQYDCILPFSGGKDSTFQLWFVVTQLKLRPLVVRYNHWGYRPLVAENNARTFKKLGVDVLEFSSNFQAVRKLMLAALKESGDFCWHCHMGVFAHTMQVAVRYKIPLIIWGESPMEYRGDHDPRDMEEFDESLFRKAVDMGVNITADKMYELLDGDIDKRDLMPFIFPTKEEIDEAGVKAIYLGNYIKWHTKHQVEVIKKELGWKGQMVEGIPPQYDYEKIECRWQGERDYCKYIKRGHGRTNFLASIDIRNGELDRDTALKLEEEYDGRRPASLDNFLYILGIGEEEFEKIVLNNEVIDWGFNHDMLKNGQELPDMKDWDNTI